MNHMLSFLKTAFLLAWAALCFFYGSNVPYVEQKDLYEALRNMSAIIFGIMGAWIAVLHPNLLTQLINQKKIQESDLPDSRHLIAPMIYAAFSLAVVLMIGIMKPIVTQSSFIMENVGVVRGLSFAVIGSLTLLQIWALILSFVPYVRVKIAQETQMAHTKKVNALAGKKSEPDK
jgi:hypothetical protein